MLCQGTARPQSLGQHRVSADCCTGGVQGRLKNPHNSELWLAAVRVEQRAGNIKAAESLMAR